VVPSILVVSNMATTAHNIQAHELLYRLGLAAHVVVTLTNIPLALIFYELFKVVNRRLALSLYGVFYGFGFICEAYLVYKSTFVPRAIGVLLAIDALNYLGVGFTTMLAPGVAAHLGAWTGLPTILAEGSLCLWLLIAGVDTGRWTEQASATIRARTAQIEGLA
jgi:Domain of unknown function (DUF4386)